MTDPNVWVLIPTAQREHVPGVLEQWKNQGYQIGVFVDPGLVKVNKYADIILMCPYPGIWKAWNCLAKAALVMGADVVVLAGDDMLPDPSLKAVEIGRQYLDRFPYGEGIMQPCGDPQGKDSTGVPAAARICGSPWVGKHRIIWGYGGQGPVNPHYHAFYADEELRLQKTVSVWMRPDLNQKHLHWSWGHMPRQDYHRRNQEQWNDDKVMFEQRKARGFPGC